MANDDNVVDLGAERNKRRPEPTTEDHLNALHEESSQPGGLFGDGARSWRDPKPNRAHEPSRVVDRKSHDSRFLQGMGLAGITAGLGIQQAASSLPPGNPVAMAGAAMGVAGLGATWVDQIGRGSSAWNKSMRRKRGEE